MTDSRFSIHPLTKTLRDNVVSNLSNYFRTDLSTSGIPASNAHERWEAAAKDWEDSKNTPGEQTAWGQVMSKAKDVSAYCRRDTMPSDLQKIATKDDHLLAHGCYIPREGLS